LCFFEAGITLKSDQHLRHRKTEHPGYAPSGAMPSGKGSRFYTDYIVTVGEKIKQHREITHASIIEGILYGHQAGMWQTFC